MDSLKGNGLLTVSRSSQHTNGCQTQRPVASVIPLRILRFLLVILSVSIVVYACLYFKIPSFTVNIITQDVETMSIRLQSVVRQPIVRPCNGGDCPNSSTTLLDKSITPSQSVPRQPIVLPCNGGDCPNSSMTLSDKSTTPFWTVDSYTDRLFRATYPDDDSFVIFQGGKKEELTFRKNPHFVPSECPTSIQQKMDSNNRGRTIYHPEIQMLINSQLFNQSEYERLTPYSMPFGYKHHVTHSFNDVLATLKPFPAKSSIFEFSEDKPRPECLSCAVVCNGGILNGSGKGKEIDSHDMVFRVNHAIRRSHEQDVGNRTTHYIFYDRSLRNTDAKDVPKDNGLIYVFLLCEPYDYKYIIQVVQGKDPKLKASANDVRFLHPDFMRYTMKIWVDTHTKSYRPTTGALMLLTALHAGCDQVSAYGIGHNNKYPVYYYDKSFRKNSPITSSHDRLSEVKILMALDRIGVINWYKRDVEEFYTKGKNST